jgi:hypothetical protein
MSTSLVQIELPPVGPPFALTQAQTILRQMVLDSVKSIHSKRNYAKALDDLFAFCASQPLSRALLMEYRTSLDHLSPSTINVRNQDNTSPHFPKPPQSNKTNET